LKNTFVIQFFLNKEFLMRSGRYIFQSTDYKAFIPAPLPPDPPVKIEGNLQSLHKN
jgi:hypothetical protein